MKSIVLKLIRVIAATLLCAATVTTVSSQPSNRIDFDALAARGEVLANQDPLAVELRNQQPDDAARRGFDIGMGAAEGQTEPGPGKQRIHDALSPAEQAGYSAAVAFSLERNRYADRAAKGAEIAEANPAIAKARNSFPNAFYKLGFDIATAIFGDPALGAQGNTTTGPGSLGIRNSLNVRGQRGFNNSMALNLRLRGLPVPSDPSPPATPSSPISRNQINKGPKISETIPEPEYRELRCRGAYGMKFKVGDWHPASTGEAMKQMIVTYTPVYEPTDSWGSNLRPGECAFADWKVTGAMPAEIRQVIVAFGQLKQQLKGTTVDESPTAAERFPDARNVPEYMQDSDHYWSFFVKNTGKGTYEASYGKYWKPAPRVNRDKSRILQP